MTYKSVSKIRYVELQELIFNDNIKIYYNNELLNYRIIKNDENLVVLDLKNSYFADTLIFYIDYEKEYKISLYSDSALNSPMLSKQILDNVPLIPDETWKTTTTKYENYYTTEKLKETGLTKEIGREQICKATEIYVYKYKVEKEYYDDNYYLNVDGYIKDINDYKIFYKEVPIINTIEITKEITKEKIIKQPQIEYIYLPSESEIKKIDSSEKIECPTQIKTQIKTVEKETFKVPKRVYMIITILILITTFLLIQLHKKYVD